MSQRQPQNDREWNEAAVNMLSRLGVNNPEVGVDGTFNVSPGRYEVVSIEQQEVQTPFSVLDSAAPDPAGVEQAVEPLANGPECVFWPCFLLEAFGIDCCRVETSYNDPRIVGEVLPVRIPDATAYLNPFNARIEGDIRTSFENDSEQGERCEKETCRCQDDSPKECNNVDGSATVDEEDEQAIEVDSLNEALDEIVATAAGVGPNQTVDREAGFRKEGALSLIESLLDILLSGTMRVNADISTTITYEWRGRRRQKSFSSTVDARLPVDNVNYEW